MVGTWTQPAFPAQDPATYKSAIDSGFMVSQRFVDAFAPRPQSTPDLTMRVDAGFVFGAGALTNTTAQNSTAFIASSRAGIIRIDRVVALIGTGVISVVSGTSLVGSIPSGYFPIAQVSFSTSSTAITSTMITDERVTPPFSRGADYQEFTTTGVSTWLKPVGFSSNADVMIAQWGAGGGGGSNANGGGGGGGACLISQTKLGLLSSAVSVTVPAGGAADSAGGNCLFGAITVYGGGPGASGSVNSGSGGGCFAAGVNNSTGGAPSGGAAGNPGGDSNYGGGGAGNANGSTGGGSVFGGGAGGAGHAAAGTAGFGGRSVYGGGGGAGKSSGGSTGTGGTSVFGGNGGGASTAAAAPGGGGARNAVGARGECRVWVFP